MTDLRQRHLVLSLELVNEDKLLLVDSGLADLLGILQSVAGPASGELEGREDGWVHFIGPCDDREGAKGRDAGYLLSERERPSPFSIFDQSLQGP